MDTFGIKLLIAVICISLITFSGAVPPAYKRHLDTVYGRAIGIILVMLTLEFGGVADWYISCNDPSNSVAVNCTGGIYYIGKEECI